MLRGCRQHVTRKSGVSEMLRGWCYKYRSTRKLIPWSLGFTPDAACCGTVRRRGPPQRNGAHPVLKKNPVRWWFVAAVVQRALRNDPSEQLFRRRGRTDTSLTTGLLWSSIQLAVCFDGHAATWPPSGPPDLGVLAALSRLGLRRGREEVQCCTQKLAVIAYRSACSSWKCDFTRRRRQPQPTIETRAHHQRLLLLLPILALRFC